MNKKHFTLVEVLVVVGIIGVLAGLIIPAVGMARQAGRRTECVSNNGQLAKLLAISMQADDNYLVSGYKYGASFSNYPAWTRYLFYKNKLQDLKGYRCPSLQTNRPSSLNGLSSDDLTSALQAALGVVTAQSAEGGKKYYGFDFRGTKRLTVSGTNSFTISPNQLILGGCATRVIDDEITPKADLFSPSNMARFYYVHGNEFNTFFLDGHVASLTKESALDAKYIPDPAGSNAIALNASDHLRNFE